MNLRICFLVSVLLSAGMAASAATHDVDIVNSSFSPATLTISVADSVRWSQVDATSHTSTSGQILYRDLTGPASAAHIHGPASAFQTADVLVDFQPFNGGAYGVSGNMSGRAILAPQILADVIDGLTYVNFHTGANGGGEIRGQINR